MKVVTAKTMGELESKAYQVGFREKEFMENAGKGIAHRTHQFIKTNQLPSRVWLLCGKGNNAGDAFVAGCILLEQGYEVTAIQIDAANHCSPLCQDNRLRFLGKKGRIIDHLVPFDPPGVILDGIFGTGFKGIVDDPYDSLINAANASKLPILAIDIPSGLNGTTGETLGSVISATETLFLGLPKTGFFLNNGWNVTGKLIAVDFGLPSEIIENASAPFVLLTEKEMKSRLPLIKRARHKYQAGYVIGLAGSPTMPGAALLSSLAALRGGSGMVRLLYPKGMEVELSASPYELIKIPYENDKVEEVIQLIQKAGAAFIGPGLGRGKQQSDLLQNVIPELNIPCVIDADALFLFANSPFKLPPETIFTPHRGEMQKLLHSSSPLELTQELLNSCQEYAEKNKLTLILKGAPTFIFHPGSLPCVNPTGDPGMATAGSGDVLTGLLASLLSQKMDCQNAARLGVYLHGLAGELAAKNRHTSYGTIASDIIEQFSTAFALLT